MNEQQTDELLALSAIFEDGVSWEHTEVGQVEMRLKVEVDWEEERWVEVWDWEAPKGEGVAEGGLEGIVKGVERLAVSKDDSEKGKERREGAEGGGKSRKRPRRRGGKGPASARPSDPSPPSPAAAPSRNRPPPSSAPRSHPRPPPPPAAAALPLTAAAPAPAPRSSSVLTLSLTKLGVATPEGHKLVHLSPSPPPPTTIDLPPTETTQGEKRPKELSLRHMPPLELALTLGAGYPEKDPPRVRVVDSVGWLGAERVGELERVLGAIWQPGEECLWMMHDLISNSSLLTTLNLSFPLTLRQLAPGLALSDRLLAHQTTTTTSAFALQTFSCPLCLSSHKGSACVRLEACSHTFCHPCLSSYFTLLITEGLIRSVACPDTECTAMRVKWERESEGGEKPGPGEVREEELERIVGGEMRSRWRVMGEKLRVESDPSISFCPRSTCLTAIPPPPDDPSTNLRVCPSCDYAYCNLCRLTWHGSHTPCALPQSGAIVSAWLEGEEKVREGLERRYGRGNVRRLVERWEEERGNREWLEGATKACPGCRVNVEKSMGCSHMCCSRCSTHFCFRCGSRISATEPYKHFSTPGLPCFNKLFDFRAGEEPPVEEWLGEILEGDAREAEGGGAEGEWHGERWNPFV